MEAHEKNAQKMREDLVRYARDHGFILASDGCLSKHIERFITMGHCPCVDGRFECPCLEVPGDVERMGRCECGILLDPARIAVPPVTNDSR